MSPTPLWGRALLHRARLPPWRAMFETASMVSQIKICPVTTCQPLTQNRTSTLIFWVHQNGRSPLHSPITYPHSVPPRCLVGPCQSAAETSGLPLGTMSPAHPTIVSCYKHTYSPSPAPISQDWEVKRIYTSYKRLVLCCGAGNQIQHLLPARKRGAGFFAFLETEFYHADL